jgi:hypothetical protein
MGNEAKSEAQEALFNAIKSSAETNMKAALRATEKARILRELAEAYRLTAGGAALGVTAAASKSNGGGRKGASRGSGRGQKSAGDSR